MPAQRFIAAIAGVLTEIAGKQTSSGVADAGAIPALDAAGRLDATMMPVGVGEDVKLIPASETLAAGDFVNIWNDGGTIKVRKADATAIGKVDDGYVLSSFAPAAIARVYFDGTNNAVTGLSAGTIHYLSATVPGAISPSPPTSPGQVVRQIGKALAATEISYEPTHPIVLA